MHDWFKKNQKTLMAVFGSLLMVTFLISGNVGRSMTRTRDNGRMIGKAGKFVLYQANAREAQVEWQQLLRSGVTESLGFGLASEMRDHPELLAMLVEEATRRGISVSDDMVQNVLKNDLPMLSFGEASLREKTARDFLLIKALRDLYTAPAKYTEPMWQHDLAGRQKLSLDIVTFEDSAQVVPPPTDQQIATLFDQYKNVPPGSAVSASNPFGFGYKVPDRVTLQYVTIPRDAVIAAVLARHSNPASPGTPDYSVLEQATVLYLENKSSYDVSIAAPSTAPSATDATGSSPSTAPSSSIRAHTFSALPPSVKTRLVDDVLAAEADELTRQIAGAVHDRMSADASHYPEVIFTPTTGPSTLPSTSPSISTAASTAPAKSPELTSPATNTPSTQAATGTAATTQPGIAVSNTIHIGGYIDEPLDSRPRLAAIAAELSAQFHVQLVVGSQDTWMAAKELPGLKEIGGARSSTGESLAQLAENAAPFNPAHAGLKLWQPSATLKDDIGGSSFVFRLSGASPSFVPDLTMVRAAVAQDATTKAQFEAATDAANRIVDASKTVAFGKVVTSLHIQPTSTGLFDASRVMSGGDPRRPSVMDSMIPNYLAAPDVTKAVAAKAEDLLTNQATAETPHPLGVVPLAADRRVLLLHLANTTLAGTEEGLQFEKMEEGAYKSRLQGEAIADSTLTYAAVAARLGYQPEAASKE